MQKPKPDPKPEKSKGGRPRKVPVYHEGEEANKRFTAGFRHILTGGPHPDPKPR